MKGGCVEGCILLFSSPGMNVAKRAQILISPDSGNYTPSYGEGQNRAVQK